MGTFARSAMTTVYTKGVKPVIFKMAPDKVHDDMITHGSWAQKMTPVIGAVESLIKYDDPALVTEAYGLTLRNPLGLGAGLDKNVAIPGILQMTGFGFLTFGSITSRVCPGNPRPWFHRLVEDESLVIHVGLANGGVDKVAARLRELRAQDNPHYTKLPFKMSIARTNDTLTGDTAEGIEDYVTSVKAIDGLSALIELNISCPNTMVGEIFTSPAALDQLLTEVDKAAPAQPIVLKMPSDKTPEHFQELVDVALDHKVAGLTISNLRKDRNSVTMDPAIKGNLSGKPVREMSTEIVRQTYLHAGDKLTIAGLGGVFTGQHAYDKICAGATLVELVSGLMFKGPSVVGTIAKELVELAHADGFERVQDAVGSRADAPVVTD